MTELLTLDARLLEDPVLYGRAFAAVSAERRDKVSRLRFERDRRLSLAAGLLLALALSRRGLDPQAPLSLGPREKPFLPGGPDFNLSHSGHFAACALSEGPVGVDVEAIQPKSHSLYARVCAPAELAALDALPEERRDAAFLRIWTAKESFLKYLGLGIAVELRDIEVRLSEPPVLRQGLAEGPVFLREYPLEGCSLTLCAGTEDLPPEAEAVSRGALEAFLR